MSKQGRGLAAIRTAEYLRSVNAQPRRWERLERHLERERLVATALKTGGTTILPPVQKLGKRARRIERQMQAMERLDRQGAA